jgi:subtilisin family serine protease
MERKGFALHIGIDRVSKQHYGDLPELNCCERDARGFLGVSEQLGFAAFLLHNNNGTSANVLAKLDEYSSTLSAGDLLWITYSGHGGQKPDLNKDEEDSWDETWCLYDRELIDDELFSAFSKFKKGVRILVFSDSCHSGTVSRAVAESYSTGVGGKTWVEYKQQHKAKSRRASFEGSFKRYLDNKDIYNQVLMQKPVDPKGLAVRVVLFAACKDDQECVEYDGHGYFTRLMLDTIPALQPKHNYTDLYLKLQEGDIGNNQNAQLYEYGDIAHDFKSEFPLSVTGKYRIIGGRAVESSLQNADTPDLIVHDGETGITTKARTITAANRGVTSSNAWDAAYRYHLDQLMKGKAVFVEPNIRSQFLKKEENRSGTRDNRYLDYWPQPDAGPDEFVWHLDDKHSELRSACAAVVQKAGGWDKIARAIRIGHVDTGYRNHPSTPAHLNKELGYNFIDDSTDTEDIDRTGRLVIEEQGHGCATMAILAGNEVKPNEGYANYVGYLGAIPFAEVVPIRICETVYNLFNANSVADAISHAVDQGCEVITMSMAGYPTKAVAKAVNRAYENGVVVVTAAGNCWFKGFKRITPDSIMYPARFERVIAATGACTDGFPYDSKAIRSNNIQMRSPGGEVMQGNWGPDSAMETALAAYTPNLPWATDEDLGSTEKYLRNGGGTSSATPQIAAAAALWIVYNRDKITQNGWGKSWKKVEAARQALFTSASKSYPAYRKYYGNGILRAHKALTAFDFSVASIDALEEAPKAHVSFLGIIPFINQWFRAKRAADSVAPESPDNNVLQEMLSLEILQLIHRDPDLLEYASHVETEKSSGYEFLNDDEGMTTFLLKISKSEYASQFLKQQVEKILSNNPNKN